MALRIPQTRGNNVRQQVRQLFGEQQRDSLHLFSVGQILIFVPHQRRIRLLQQQVILPHLSLLLFPLHPLHRRRWTNPLVESPWKIFINLLFFTARRVTFPRPTEIIVRRSIRVLEAIRPPLLSRLLLTPTPREDRRIARRSRNWLDLVETRRRKIIRLRREFVRSVRTLDSSLFPIKSIDEPWRKVSNSIWWLSVSDNDIPLSLSTKDFLSGQSGLGKSTFINTLFQTELYGQDFPSTVHRKKKTISIDSSSIILKEKGVQLRLTIVDTPGFGDAVDNSNWFVFRHGERCVQRLFSFSWQPILDYIDAKYEEYLNAESRVVRKSHIVDNRVHCCLYFLTPSGHR